MRIQRNQDSRPGRGGIRTRRVAALVQVQGQVEKRVQRGGHVAAHAARHVRAHRASENLLNCTLLLLVKLHAPGQVR